MSEERIPLTINVTAPTFQLTDIFDRSIDLAEYKGKKVFISFFRFVGCPFCNLRVHALTKEYETLKAKGLEMIFFFESRKQRLLASTFHQQVSPIPLISDPERIWYSTYGIEQNADKSTRPSLTTFIRTAIGASRQNAKLQRPKDGESLNTMPAEFLIDENGIIRKVYYSRMLNDHMPLAQVHAFADSGKAVEA